MFVIMKKIIVFLLLALPLNILAQITDDFSDGDFTNNPCWTGDTEQFEINSSGHLHLNSTQADTSYLSLSSTYFDNAEWQFWVRLSFKTSANNNARVYLVADNECLENSLNAYFVQIGEKNDSIGLFRQSGDDVQEIIPGTIAYTNNSTNILRIKVTHNNSGIWKLFSDITGGENFLSEGECFDDTPINPAFSGVFCKYTSSNKTKFYFDDFYIGPIIIDTLPPEIISVYAVSDSELDILFSENIDKQSAETPGNFLVNNNIGNPFLAIRDNENFSLVHLYFENSFSDGNYNTITIKNIKDFSDNIITETNRDFVFYNVKAYNIVINEIMADPSPTVDLPEYEYIELYNKTPFPINLDMWSITIGNSKKIFPNVTIDADDYLILTKNDAYQELSPFGNIITFDAFSITNSGQTIVLKNQYDNIIHSISFTDDWYNNEYKKEGGWSLEQIDPQNPCGCKNNWAPSTNSSGGTPGTENSVFAQNPDNIIPEILRAYIVNDSSVQIFFTEPLDSIYLKNQQNYFVDNNIGYPETVYLMPPDYVSVLLLFDKKFQKKTTYNLFIKDTICDCVGNILEINSFVSFAIPDSVEKNDIAINEILFNPKNDGVDFLEIYNRSDKVIDLKNLCVCSKDTIENILTSVNNISKTGYLMFPQEYLVLTINPDKVKQQYFTENPSGFLKVEKMPAFADDNGIVVIADKSSNIIDEMIYSDDMHFALLNTTDGVSLERIDYDRSAMEKTNWHSAAQSTGFATPAYKNSQFINNIENEKEVSVSPKIFSPDNDGYNDVLNINYNFDEPGYLANISIYDAKGRLIKHLIKNELLGTKGSFTWDGINDDNERANIGIYIIYIKIFNLKGNVKKFKKTAVLALPL